MKSLICVLATLAIQSAHAALPPLWQDVAELKAILNDERFSKDSRLQSGDSIEDIKKIEGGWMIYTNKQQVPIRVIYGDQTMPGPAKFTIEFGKTFEAPAEKTPKTESQPTIELPARS